jgi:exosortase/archaeosortase
MKTLSEMQYMEVSGGSNRGARQRLTAQRTALYGAPNQALKDCIVISGVAALAGLVMPLSTPIGAGLSAYVCSVK